MLRGSHMTHLRKKTSPRPPATIRQVAAAAGVSVATVSRAFDKPNVLAEGTLRRVRKVIAELRYTPNAQALMLRTSRTRLVIALVPDIANPFFSEVIRGIEKVANAQRYSVLLGDTQYDAGREDRYFDMLSRRQADGLITLVPHLPRNLADLYAPIVSACEYVRDSSVTTVYVDNLRGSQQAVEHLIELGHRHIAYISGPATSAICQDRAAGYRLALKVARLPVYPQLVRVGDFSVESGIRATKELLRSRCTFTAIACGNDEMAIGAMRALEEAGRSIPEDTSVVGFDDISFARYTKPALTTIAQPKLELGMKAMTCLAGLLADPSRAKQRHILRTELVVRNSTARAPDDTTAPRSIGRRRTSQEAFDSPSRSSLPKRNPSLKA